VDELYQVLRARGDTDANDVMVCSHGSPAPCTLARTITIVWLAISPAAGPSRTHRRRRQRDRGL
jgi:hypothetical protein